MKMYFLHLLALCCLVPSALSAAAEPPAAAIAEPHSFYPGHGLSLAELRRQLAALNNQLSEKMETIRNWSNQKKELEDNLGRQWRAIEGLGQSLSGLGKLGLSPEQTKAVIQDTNQEIASKESEYAVHRREGDQMQSTIDHEIDTLNQDALEIRQAMGVINERLRRLEQEQSAEAGVARELVGAARRETVNDVIESELNDVRVARQRIERLIAATRRPVLNVRGLFISARYYTHEYEPRNMDELLNKRLGDFITSPIPHDASVAERLNIFLNYLGVIFGVAGDVDSFIVDSGAMKETLDQPNKEEFLRILQAELDNLNRDEEKIISARKHIKNNPEPMPVEHPIVPVAQPLPQEPARPAAAVAEHVVLPEEVREIAQDRFAALTKEQLEEQKARLNAERVKVKYEESQKYEQLDRMSKNTAQYNDLSREIGQLHARDAEIDRDDFLIDHALKYPRNASFVKLVWPYKPQLTQAPVADIGKHDECIDFIVRDHSMPSPHDVEQVFGVRLGFGEKGDVFVVPVLQQERAGGKKSNFCGYYSLYFAGALAQNHSQYLLDRAKFCSVFQRLLWLIKDNWDEGINDLLVERNKSIREMLTPAIKAQFDVSKQYNQWDFTGDSRRIQPVYGDPREAIYSELTPMEMKFLINKAGLSGKVALLELQQILMAQTEVSSFIGSFELVDNLVSKKPVEDFINKTTNSLVLIVVAGTAAGHYFVVKVTRDDSGKLNLMLADSLNSVEFYYNNPHQIYTRVFDLFNELSRGPQ